MKSALNVLLLTLFAACQSPAPANRDVPEPEAVKLAIIDGDHNQLARLLTAGADANGRLTDGSVPLAWAAERQDPIAVETLLRHGASVDDQHPAANELRPLIAACLHPEARVLSLLLDQQPDVNVRGSNGVPALSLCAAYASGDVVRQLLAQGAPADVTDDHGQTPLMWAAAHDRLDAFKQLLAHGAELEALSRGGFTALMFAAKSGTSAVAAVALRRGAKINRRAPDGTSLVQLAMHQQNYSLAALLIERHADVDAYDRNGRQLLHAAAIANQPALIRLLLAQGADPNALTRDSDVRWRFESNFKAGDYHFPPTPPLTLAAQNGHAAALRALLDGGADPHYRDASGNTMIHAAARSADPTALAVALTQVPEPNLQNAAGDTPLHTVLKWLPPEQLDGPLRVLAEFDARVDVPSTTGETPRALASDPHFKGRAAYDRWFEPVTTAQSAR